MSPNPIVGCFLHVYAVIVRMPDAHSVIIRVANAEAIILGIPDPDAMADSG